MTLIGVIPAAGRATRISPLPCSKELLPVGIEDTAEGLRLKPVCSFLLDQFRIAGIETAYVVTRTEKTDVAGYLGSGEAWGVDLAYLMLAHSSSVPETVSRAAPYVSDATVALGFPDIILRPDNAFLLLAEAHVSGGADVTLGLFPVDEPSKVDVVAFDDRLEVSHIEVKPDATDLSWTWMCALWEPSFTEFLHRESATLRPDDATEVHMGHMMQKAILDGRRIRAFPIEDGWYRDIGTPEDLRAALKDFS